MDGARSSECGVNLLSCLSFARISSYRFIIAHREPMNDEGSLITTMALNQVGKVSAKAARAVRDGYAASMASVVSVFLLMCE